MLVREWRFIAPALLFLGIAATDVGFLAHAPAMGDEPRSSPTGPPPPVAAQGQDANPNPAPGRMFVVGRVLDPKGEPVTSATVVIHARSLASVRPPYLTQQIPIADGRADRSGRFRIDAPRTSSSRHASFGAVALAPGYGVGWVELDPDDEQPTAADLAPAGESDPRAAIRRTRPARPRRLPLGRLDSTRAAAGPERASWPVRWCLLWAEGRQRLSRMAPAGDDRSRGPLHPPRRGP